MRFLFRTNGLSAPLINAQSCYAHNKRFFRQLLRTQWCSQTFVGFCKRIWIFDLVVKALKLSRSFTGLRYVFYLWLALIRIIFGWRTIAPILRNNLTCPFEMGSLFFRFCEYCLHHYDCVYSHTEFYSGILLSLLDMLLAICFVEIKKYLNVQLNLTILGILISDSPLFETLHTSCLINSYKFVMLWWCWYSCIRE